MLRERASILRDMDDYAGRYVSHMWIRKNVLRQTEEEIEQNDEEMEAELDDPRFAAPAVPAAQTDGGESDQLQQNQQLDNERPQ